MGLYEVPHCQLDVGRLHRLVHESPRERQKLLERWIQEQPLYRAPSKYPCDRTFMKTAAEMEYIRRANAECSSAADTEVRYAFFAVPECVQYWPLWREEHRAYSAVKTMDGLRRVLKASVIDVERTLFRRDSVLCDGADEDSR